MLGGQAVLEQEQPQARMHYHLRDQGTVIGARAGDIPAAMTMENDRLIQLGGVGQRGGPEPLR